MCQHVRNAHWQAQSLMPCSCSVQLSPPPPLPLHMATGMGPTAFHEQLRYRDAQIAKLAGEIQRLQAPRACTAARYGPRLVACNLLDLGRKSLPVLLLVTLCYCAAGAAGSGNRRSWFSTLCCWGCWSRMSPHGGSLRCHKCTRHSAGASRLALTVVAPLCRHAGALQGLGRAGAGAIPDVQCRGSPASAPHLRWWPARRHAGGAHVGLDTHQTVNINGGVAVFPCACGQLSAATCARPAGDFI